jgi:hypothetical protein
MAELYSEKKRLYLAQETGGYGVDPDADGSDYQAVRTIGRTAFASQGAAVLETNEMTGRNRGSPHVIGVQGS